MNPRYLIPILTGVAGLATGAGVGYYVAAKRLETKYSKISEEEIAEAKRYYRTVLVKPEMEEALPVIDKEQLEEAKTIIETHYYKSSETLEEIRPPVEEDDAPEPETRNAFDGLGDPDNPEVPYIIRVEEFQENEPGHEQLELTYFAGDDVLVTESDDIVDDVDRLVGEDSLARFGEGTNDNRFLYVRNDVLATDFEIQYSNADYAAVVAGFIQHSADRGSIRKFRLHDE